MVIDLYASSKTRDVKKQFARLFPFLKLEFFARNHGPGQISDPEQVVGDEVALIDIRGVVREGRFYFEPSISVAEFEQRIQKYFGLPVQVFRKSGELWMETTQTDQLSLEKQNTKGKESSFPLRFNINTLFL